MLRLASILLLVTSLLSACAGAPEFQEETAGWSAQRLYSAAQDEVKSGNYAKAIKYFETLESRYPYGKLAAQAQIESAYAHFKDNDIAGALAGCDRFIKLHPNHPNVDYAYYLKGLVNFNDDLGLLGQLGAQDLSERDPKSILEAFEAFKELISRFPDSKYAPDARARMKYLINALASHEVHVASYYLKRGAYLAAVNRAQYALKTYPQAPAIEEALFVMVKSYDSLGMNDLRDDSDRVMRKNFPNSRFFERAKNSKESWWKFW